MKEVQSRNIHPPATNNKIFLYKKKKNIIKLTISNKKEIYKYISVNSIKRLKDNEIYLRSEQG